MNEFLHDTLLWMDNGYTIAIFPDHELVFRLNGDLKPLGEKFMRDRILANIDRDEVYYIVSKNNDLIRLLKVGAFNGAL